MTLFMPNIDNIVSSLIEEAGSDADRADFQGGKQARGLTGPLRIWLHEKKKNDNHFFFCPRWKISSFLLPSRKKWKWKIKSVSSWLECCARMCRHLCFVLFLSVCVCIYIYIEFLSSFAVFFMILDFWTVFNLSHAFLHFASDVHSGFLNSPS